MGDGGDSDSTGRIGRRRVIETLGAASALGLAGCTSTGGSGGVDSLTVGYATSLSGPFAVFGQSALDGARLAKADLESELDVSIEVVTADTKLAPSTGLQRIRRLVTEDGVDFVLGAVSSAVALKMGAWATDNEVLYVPTGAHSDALTGGSCGEFVFRPTCSNSMLANTIGSRMAEQADRWYLLYSDYSWGQTAQAAVTRVLEERGKTVVGTSAVPFPNDDYTSYLNSANNADAAGIGLLIAGLDLRKATNQLVAKGMQEDHTLAMHQLEDVVYWGLDREAAGVLDAAGQVWGPAVEADAARKFAERVVENSETDPYVRHFLGYAAMDQAVRAAHRAGSTAAPDMRDALEGHEVSSKLVDIKGNGPMRWRAGDHQLVQPTYGVSARPVGEMTDDPYRRWFGVVEQFPGEEVARPVAETGCSL